MYYKTCEEVERDNSAARFPIIPTSSLTGYVEWETILPEKPSMFEWVTTNTKPRSDVERVIGKTTKGSRMDYVESYWAVCVNRYNYYVIPD